MSQLSHKRPMTSQDLFAFKMVDDPQLSPDGKHVAFVKTWLSQEENAYRSNIFVMDLATGESRQLTHGKAQDTHPRWSPDGQFIAYLASVKRPPQDVATAESFLGKLSQLHSISVSDGATQVLTNLVGGVQGHTWSPDGKHLAFTTLINPEAGLEYVHSDAPADLYAKYNQDVLVAERVRWKSDALGYVGNYYRHIALLEFDGTAKGTPVLLTSGTSDFSAPTWSPDGKSLAVAGNLEASAEWQRKSYVYLLDPSSPLSPPKELCGLEEMRSNDLTFSPDGTYLAVCGHDDPVKGHYGLQKLWLITVATGSKTCVSSAHDVSLGDFSRNQDMRRYGGNDGPRWSADGKRLLVLLNEKGTVQLASFSTETNDLTALTTGDHAIFAFTSNPEQTRIITLITDNTNPCDLFLLENPDLTTRTNPLQRLTNINQDFFNDVHVTTPERFQSHSSGVSVDGWIYPPLNVEAGKKYPVILYTGGGPGGMRASVFCHEWQLYAAQGYAVINCNARGNYGYGEAFSEATRGQWGGLDYEDNMAYLQDALAAFDYLDETRLAVAGGSYGGYMASWIISRHHNFKAAVVDRSLFNRMAFHHTGDIGFLLDKIEFEGRLPWEDPQLYLERSPAHYVADIKTPTLVVHSELDHRCPVGNGEQLYLALKRLGVETKFVRFSNETHELSRGGRPWHRVFRLDNYAAWFDEWL